MSVAVLPETHSSESPLRFVTSTPSPGTIWSALNVIVVLPSTPVSLSFAFSISLPRTSCLLILISAGAKSSVIVRLSDVTLVSSETSLPSLIVNLISVVTTYPSGAATSWRTYSPSGRFLTQVDVLPDFHVSSLPLLEIISASEGASSCSAVNTISSLPFLPVRVSFAPSISFL